MRAWTTALLAASAVVVPAIAAARDEIHVVGSSTVYPFSKRVGELFAADSSNIPPKIESTGTGAGIAQFCAGSGPDFPDIAGASRAMTRAEWESCHANGVWSITQMLIGYDGLSIAAEKSSAPDVSFTLSDLYTALAERIPVDGVLVPNPTRTWSDVRPELPDVPIRVIGPPKSSGTRDAFVDLAMHRGCEASLTLLTLKASDPDEWDRVCSTMRTDGAYVEAGEDDEAIVADVKATEGTFGILGYSYVFEHYEVLEGIAIEGIVPSEVTIATREYPLARPLYLYIKNDNRAFVPGMSAFIREYIQDAAPDGSLLELGLVPIFDDTDREQAAGDGLDGVPMLPPGSETTASR